MSLKRILNTGLIAGSLFLNSCGSDIVEPPVDIPPIDMPPQATTKYVAPISGMAPLEVTARYACSDDKGIIEYKLTKGSRSSTSSNPIDTSITFTGTGSLVMSCTDTGKQTTSYGPISIQVTQPPVNNPPQITSTCPTQIEENAFYQCQVQATDPDGDAINYRVIQGPSWLNFSSNTLFGRAPEVLEDTDFNVEFQVRDIKGLGTNQSFNLTVQNVYNTHVLTTEDLGQISSIQNNQIVFSQPQDFSQGDVIIGGISDRTPYGILRGVTNISADRREINTEQVSLEHALKRGSFSFNQALSSSSAKLSQTVPEGVSETHTPGFEFSYDLTNVVLEERFGGIVVNGNVSFNLTPFLDANFDEQSIEAKFIMDEKIDIKLSSNLSLFIPAFQESFPLINLPPIPVVGTPVVITPRIDIVVGVMPARIASLEARVIQNADIRPGLLYRNGSWENISSLESSFNFSVNSSSIREMDVEVYAGPFIKLFLNDYGLITPGVQAGVNGNLRFEAGSNDDWKLWGGIAAGIGVDPGRFLKRFISPYFEPVVGDTTLLAESGGIVPSTGRIAFVSTRDGNFEIYSMDPDGLNQINLTNHIAADWYPSWSPDGTKIVFSSTRNNRSEIYTMNSDGFGVRRLTNDFYQDILPEWSPDGNKILYISTRGGIYKLFTMDLDGAQQSELEISLTDDILSASWSPDGNKIVLQTYKDRNWEIYTMNMNGTGLARITNNSFSDVSPVWSPQGDLIAFASDRDGTFDIYTMDTNGGNIRRITDDSVNNLHPSWSPDGTRIIFEYNNSLSPTENSEIYIVNADGTGQRNLTNSLGVDSDPVWSPF